MVYAKSTTNESTGTLKGERRSSPAVVAEERKVTVSNTCISTRHPSLDAQGFESFYREQLGPVYRYVYSKVGNREEAEDLTSQIFLKAVRGLDLTRDPHSTRTWLFQVARTTIADYWRIHSRLATSSLEDLLEVGWEGPSEEEPSLLKSESTERVQCILQALSERDREVLTCRFLLNLSVRETALKMGLSETNVKVVQFRALKRVAALDAG